MEFIESIKARIPDYAKDIRLNLDGTISREEVISIAQDPVSVQAKLQDYDQHQQLVA